MGIFVLLLHGWQIDVGSPRPNPRINETIDFDVSTMIARAFRRTVPVAKLGDKVRIRRSHCYRRVVRCRKARAMAGNPRGNTPNEQDNLDEAQDRTSAF